MAPIIFPDLEQFMYDRIYLFLESFVEFIYKTVIIGVRWGYVACSFPKILFKLFFYTFASNWDFYFLSLFDIKSEISIRYSCELFYYCKIFLSFIGFHIKFYLIWTFLIFAGMSFSTYCYFNLLLTFCVI